MTMCGCGLRLELRIVQPHSPIRNPEITEEAARIEGDLASLAKVLLKEELSPHDRILHTEAFLLSQWKAREQWKRYLDSPLISHVDAALQLRQNYDAVVGIKNAGIPYAQIFEMVGFPIFEIDYSHRKRDMKEPQIDDEKVKQLRDKKSVLLTDIDFVTGKALREVTRYLREKDVKVNGAYIGLFRWPGMKSEKSEEFFIGNDTVNFDTFWKGRTSGLSTIRSTLPYKKGLIPSDVALYTSNPFLEEDELKGSAAARRIAKYFLESKLSCMKARDKLEGRVKDALRPVFIPFQDEALLDEISERLVQRTRFIELLDNSYAPMDELVQHFYHTIEQELINFRQTLLINPEGTRNILRSRDQEAQKYEILGRVVDELLKKEALDYFARRNLQIQHFPHDLLVSFSSVRKVMDEGMVDIGVAIGPEGFVYASMFELLGLPIRNIYIDEYCRTENRPYKELDDISVIRGKHTLLIEDDVRTGKTLEKAYSKIRRYSPADVSVYLGIPEKSQNLQNVPREFRKVYTTPNSLTDEQIRAEIDKAKEILERKYSIFKK
ncbi:MAG: phosphoribosyltransferase [Candidatus Pacearchaeota archaeon]